MSWEFDLIPERGKFSEESLAEIRAKLEAMPFLPMGPDLYAIFEDAATRDLVAEGIRLHGRGSYVPRAAFVRLGADRLILEMMGDTGDDLLFDIAVWCQNRWPSVLVTSAGRKVTADVFKKPGQPG